jgi:hypothetical protein
LEPVPHISNTVVLNVDMSLNGMDHATIGLGQTSLDELSLFNGDLVQVKGRKGKKVMAIVQLDNSITGSTIKTNSVIASNLRYNCTTSLYLCRFN